MVTAPDSMPPHPRDGEVEIHDGGLVLGRLVDTPACRVHAQLADGRDLGLYPNRAAASHAVLTAPRWA